MKDAQIVRLVLFILLIGLLIGFAFGMGVPR